MTLCGFLSHLGAFEGVQAALGLLYSWLIEYWQGFQNLDAKWKRLVIMGICLGVSVLSQVTAYALKCIPELGQEQIWQAILAGFVAFGASQFAHIRKL